MWHEPMRLSAVLMVLGMYCLGGQLATAATPSQVAASALKQCYFVAAYAYGANKCDPPPMIFPSVRGRCSSEEDWLLDALSQEAKVRPGDPNETARIAMNYVLSKLEPQVQSWILDAQIKAGGCAKPGGN
jgi:hypothetical protein